MIKDGSVFIECSVLAGVVLTVFLFKGKAVRQAGHAPVSQWEKPLQKLSWMQNQGPPPLCAKSMDVETMALPSFSPDCKIRPAIHPPLMN